MVLQGGRWSGDTPLARQSAVNKYIGIMLKAAVSHHLQCAMRYRIPIIFMSRLRRLVSAGKNLFETRFGGCWPCVNAAFHGTSRTRWDSMTDSSCFVRCLSQSAINAYNENNTTTTNKEQTLYGISETESNSSCMLNHPEKIPSVTFYVDD